MSTVGSRLAELAFKELQSWKKLKDLQNKQLPELVRGWLPPAVVPEGIVNAEVFWTKAGKGTNSGKSTCKDDCKPQKVPRPSTCEEYTWEPIIKPKPCPQKKCNPPFQPCPEPEIPNHCPYRPPPCPRCPPKKKECDD